MRVFIAVLILIFSLQSWTKADDISDFEIEGMSIGDSLLDYMSINEIKKSFARTKDHYTWLKEPLKFREAYIFTNPNFETYSSMSFLVNPDDNNYRIFFIRGMKEYVNSMDLCLKKRNEIASEIEKIISKFKKRESNFKSHLDKSGKSYYKQLVYRFNLGDEILISCNDWEEKIRKKNNWTEGLSVAIQRKEIADWWINKK